jgi:hypothetical protein
MRIPRRKARASEAWFWLFVLGFVCFCALGKTTTTLTASAAEVVDSTGEAEGDINTDSFDEDELVRETIAAGRGYRSEHGIRDQWLSDEHLGKESEYDSRKPISADVKRLLQAYRLKCEGCDHSQAVRKVNAYVKETKRLAREEKEAQEHRDAWARKIFAALVVAGLSAAYVYRKELGVEFLLENGRRGGGDDLSGFSEAQRANILRLRREQAADAASKRQKEQKAEAPPPTWLENEQKEIWTPKQEKQFQKALREFSGVPKKERYKLIAEKVQGKSRIECLTHHRMQELLAKREQEEQQ